MRHGGRDPVEHVGDQGQQPEVGWGASERTRHPGIIHALHMVGEEASVHVVPSKIQFLRTKVSGVRVPDFSCQARREQISMCLPYNGCTADTAWRPQHMLEEVPAAEAVNEGGHPYIRDGVSVSHDHPSSLYQDTLYLQRRGLGSRRVPSPKSVPHSLLPGRDSARTPGSP